MPCSTGVLLERDDAFFLHRPVEVVEAVHGDEHGEVGVLGRVAADDDVIDANRIGVQQAVLHDQATEAQSQNAFQ